MTGVDDNEDGGDSAGGGSGDDPAAYWQRLAGQINPRQVAGRRRPGKPDLQETADITDPTVLIVRTLLDNVAITKEMMTESQAARMAMAEAMRKTALQADTMSAEMRSVTIALQHLVRQQATKWDRYIWAGVGFILGAVVMEASLTTLPALWRQIFG